MHIKDILIISQIVIGILIIASILIQQRGAGIGTAFGGEGDLYRSKRGVERLLFIATIILSTLFAVNTILTFIL